MKIELRPADQPLPKIEYKVKPGPKPKAKDSTKSKRIGRPPKKNPTSKKDVQKTKPVNINLGTLDGTYDSAWQPVVHFWEFFDKVPNQDGSETLYKTVLTKSKQTVQKIGFGLYKPTWECLPVMSEQATVRGQTITVGDQISIDGTDIKARVLEIIPITILNQKTTDYHLICMTETGPISTASFFRLSLQRRAQMVIEDILTDPFTKPKRGRPRKIR
jgi:hypothetical protein